MVSFHSLEDRIVKSFFAERSGRATATSRYAPPAPSAASASFRLLFKGAKTAGGAEVAENPRSRSAKLRAAVRTAAPPLRLAA